MSETNGHKIDIADLTERCPWFVERMTEDDWSFGLHMIDGLVIGITNIRCVTDYGGHLWADVTLMDEHHVKNIRDAWCIKYDIIGAPTSRLDASINLSHVVAAFELADT